MESRRCSYCKKKLPITSFRKRDKIRNGRIHVCLDCECLKKREYNTRVQNKEDATKSNYYQDLLDKYEHTEADKTKEKIRDSLKKKLKDKASHCLLCGELLRRMHISVLKLKDKDEYQTTICCNTCATALFLDLKRANTLKESGFFNS